MRLSTIRKIPPSYLLSILLSDCFELRNDFLSLFHFCDSKVMPVENSAIFFPLDAAVMGVNVAADPFTSLRTTSEKAALRLPSPLEGASNPESCSCSKPDLSWGLS